MSKRTIKVLLNPALAEALFDEVEDDVKLEFAQEVSYLLTDESEEAVRKIVRDELRAVRKIVRDELRRIASPGKEEDVDLT